MDDFFIQLFNTIIRIITSSETSRLVLTKFIALMDRIVSSHDY